MHRTSIRAAALSVSLLVACGGTATSSEETTVEPVAQAEPGPEPAASTEAPAEEPTEAPPEPAEPSEPAAPPAQPIRPESADDIRAALATASNDETALHNLIDPAWGVGSYDPSNTGIEHHCDRDEFTSHPGMGFVVREDDRFTCDRRMRRCLAADPHGGGFVFHFRDGPGSAIWLNTVIHYQSTVPRSDSRAIRAFVEGGDGVCALWRAIDDEDAGPPQKLSVFVAAQTGLVPEVLAAHLCGDEAAGAYRQRVTPYLARNPDLHCTRNPSRCGLVRGDEEVTLYGGPEGLVGVAITRPGMHAHLARSQQRDLDAWRRGIAGHSCDDGGGDLEL